MTPRAPSPSFNLEPRMKSLLFFDAMPAANLRAMTALTFAAALLAACDTGPSEAEFLAVCLKEGQTAVNQAISKRMGIDRDKYCKCAAKEARTALSADGYRWMMLNMENKKTESRALAAKMNEAQQTELMAAALEVSAKCATGEVLGPVKKP